MTSDKDQKSPRRILTIRGVTPSATQQRTINSHGSTVVVINSGKNAERDNNQQSTLSQTRSNELQAVVRAAMSREKQAEIFETKRAIRNLDTYVAPQKQKIDEPVREKAPEPIPETKQQKSEKSDKFFERGKFKPRPQAKREEVNFDHNAKKLVNLDTPKKPIAQKEEEKKKTIQTAVGIKSIDSNRKKVTHSKPSKIDDDEQNSNAKKGKLAEVGKNRFMPNKFSASYKARVLSGDDFEESGFIRRKNKSKSKISKRQEKIIRDVAIGDEITVQELASRMSEKSGAVIKALMRLGIMATINQSIDSDVAELIVIELGHRPQKLTHSDIVESLTNNSNVDGTLEPRPPVVTIMGHVDHGKTSLLDALRETDVAGKEHGGITQHIGAYQLHLPNGGTITFLDTPGHEAFSAMRMRGAKVTDIVVLVVAADDGIKMQTIEAINHAKAANVPIIVAINKIDKPDANIPLVTQSLLQHSIIPDTMGGDVMVVGVSALTKEGLDKLEEVILLQADLLDLKADYKRNSKGYVIEAKLDKMKGNTATLLVKSGILKNGDVIAVGNAYGKIRVMSNDKGESVDEAKPSMPIEITGLSAVPVAGDEFIVMPSEKAAKELISINKQREELLHSRNVKGKSLHEMFVKANEKTKEMSLIIKGDVQGSVEAIVQSLQKINDPEINVKVIHNGTGGINESDITLALASNALVVGFNVRASNSAKDLATIHGVNIKYYSIIYDLIDDVRSIITDMLDPIMKENIIGMVEIRKIFATSKFGNIAGCYVKNGIVKKNAGVRLLRDNIVIHTGKLDSLKRQKDDAKEVKEGFECGITLDRYDDIRENDMLEIFEIVEEKKKLQTS